MILDDLVKNPGAWLATGRDTGVALSHRIRLARNVKGEPFPGWAGVGVRRVLRERLFETLRDIPALRNGLFLNMDSLDALDRETLKERRLISLELVEQDKGQGGGVVVSEDEQIAIMINEEDHFRIQGIGSGMDARRTWTRLRELDEEIEQRVEYAFSSALGYLTACPSNVGTGLRVSVMMHLPGLRIMDEMGPAAKGLEKMGLAVRGLNGEGTEAWGNLYQISNQSTLGESEEALLDRMLKIGLEMAMHEENARTRALESRGVSLRDHVGRAFGIVRHATMLSFQEAVDLLSALRLGVDLGLIGRLSVGRINEALLLTQPAHLQKMAGAVKTPDERDEWRARMTRDMLGSATLKGARGRRAAGARSAMPARKSS